MSCPKCKLALSGTPKTYSVSGGGITFHFDVAKAEAIAKHLPSRPVPEWLLRTGLVVNTFDERHLDHVDMAVPLLFGTLPNVASVRKSCTAHMRAQLKDPKMQIFVFLDGSHRAARALRDGIAVEGKFLTVAQTLQCIAMMESSE